MIAIINHDLPCVRCGYNLRTLAREGQCPECGSQVALSVSHAELPRPAELLRLAHGTAMLAGGNAFLIPWTLGVMSYSLDDWNLGSSFFRYLLPCLIAAYGIWVVTASWILTAEHEAGGLRLWARIIRWASMLVVLVSWAAAGEIFFMIQGRHGWAATLSIVILVLSPSVWVRSFYLGRFFEDRCMAARLPTLAALSAVTGQGICLCLIACEAAAVVLPRGAGFGAIAGIVLVPGVVILVTLFAIVVVTQAVMAWRFFLLHRRLQMS